MQNRNLSLRRNARNNKSALVESIMTKIEPIINEGLNAKSNIKLSQKQIEDIFHFIKSIKNIKHVSPKCKRNNSDDLVDKLEDAIGLTITSNFDVDERNTLWFECDFGTIIGYVSADENLLFKPENKITLFDDVCETELGEYDITSFIDNCW